MTVSGIRDMEQAGVLFLRKISLPLMRLALFVVYFWFGILKVVGQSPANPLVEGLMERTIPFLSFEQFIIGFGLYEMLIGIAFLIPRFKRSAFFLVIPHLIMTTSPLVLLPAVAWSGMMIPSLEGQYIIKNILILAVAVAVFTAREPSEA